MGDAKYKVAANGSVGGVLICGADPLMQSAYRDFVEKGLGVANPLVISVPGLTRKFLSPLTVKFAADLLDLVAESVRENGVGRVVCVVRKDDIDHPIVRHLVHVPPPGSSFEAHVLAMAKSFIKGRLRVDVELYLAEVKGEDVEFSRLDA